MTPSESPLGGRADEESGHRCAGQQGDRSEAEERRRQHEREREASTQAPRGRAVGQDPPAPLAGPSVRKCPSQDERRGPAECHRRDHDYEGVVSGQEDGERARLQEEVDDQRSGAESADRAFSHDLERTPPVARAEAVRGVRESVEVDPARQQRLERHRDARGEKRGQHVLETDADKSDSRTDKRADGWKEQAPRETSCSPRSRRPRGRSVRKASAAAGGRTIRELRATVVDSRLLERRHVGE